MLRGKKEISSWHILLCCNLQIAIASRSRKSSHLGELFPLEYLIQKVHTERKTFLRKLNAFMLHWSLSAAIISCQPQNLHVERKNFLLIHDVDPIFSNFVRQKVYFVRKISSCYLQLKYFLWKLATSSHPKNFLPVGKNFLILGKFPPRYLPGLPGLWTWDLRFQDGPESDVSLY